MRKGRCHQTWFILCVCALLLARDMMASNGCSVMWKTYCLIAVSIINYVCSPSVCNTKYNVYQSHWSVRNLDVDVLAWKMVYGHLRWHKDQPVSNLSSITLATNVGQAVARWACAVCAMGDGRTGSWKRMWREEERLLFFCCFLLGQHHFRK